MTQKPSKLPILLAGFAFIIIAGIISLMMVNVPVSQTQVEKVIVIDNKNN